MAVKDPRFSTRRHWAISAQARELLDDIYAEVAAASATPRAVVASSESIVMSGPSIRATYRSESGHAALVEINQRMSARRRRSVPAPAASGSSVVWATFTIGVLTVAILLKVLFTGSLL
jgi:hypothetical protein